ncbi:MAG: radical SAM family heme chaperone HemW [Anaerolineae bacterium]|nr:radical SAM family heme chaperone HemW [Anaerolineae bacterium]
MEPLSLYLHIPFCQRKCPYCDFNTYAGLNRLHEPYAEALAQEIRLAGAQWDRPAVHTVFLGGGTPTVLEPALLERVLVACREAFYVLPDAEVTSEANPGTVDVSRFAVLRRLGVNRLSMGVQSFDPAELAFLGRIHSAEEAVDAFWAARAAGFDNINLDFIYGLPGQSPATWRRTLERAIALGPEHLSLYALTIEEGTPFGEWAAAGRLAYPDADLAADLYELADELLAAAGYVQYEISNWAKDGGTEGRKGKEEKPDNPVPSPPSFAASPSLPSWACRHNLTYWRNEAYLGCGPGAHSSVDGRRWANIKPVPAYIERVTATAAAWTAPAAYQPFAAPWVEFVEELDERTRMAETMILGLRLVREGVSFERFAQRHGRPLAEVFGSDIERLARQGQVEVRPDRVRLTQRARLLGNQVFVAFLG